MNSKRVKAIRKFAKSKGIDVRDVRYISPGRRVILAATCGRSIYKQLKKQGIS